MYHTADPVMIDLANYERAQDAGGDVDAMLDARVDDATEQGGECYPFSADNLRDACGYIDLDDIADLLARKQYPDAAELLHSRVEDYWRETAERLAKEELNLA